MDDGEYNTEDFTLINDEGTTVITLPFPGWGDDWGTGWGGTPEVVTIQGGETSWTDIDTP